jgi:hypothetical protein
MPHVVQPFTNKTFAEAINLLRAAHEFLTARAKSALQASDEDGACWGIALKRSSVDLSGDGIPSLIGKTEEKLGEVINIAATVERLIDAIKWFAEQAEFNVYTILECHPSTSDDFGGNDLVIVDSVGQPAIRCEVCDVASSNAGSNGKEKKDLSNLGCGDSVPDDGVFRYICTAPEFADALVSNARNWNAKPYRYQMTQTGSLADTRMLRILPPG